MLLSLCEESSVPLKNLGMTWLCFQHLKVISGKEKYDRGFKPVKEVP